MSGHHRPSIGLAGAWTIKLVMHAPPTVSILLALRWSLLWRRSTWTGLTAHICLYTNKNLRIYKDCLMSHTYSLKEIKLIRFDTRPISDPLLEWSGIVQWNEWNYWFLWELSYIYAFIEEKISALTARSVARELIPFAALWTGEG